MDQKKKNLVMTLVAVAALGVGGYLISRQFTTPPPPKPSEKTSTNTNKIIDEMKKSDAEARKRNPPPPEEPEAPVEPGSARKAHKGG